jgi:hypothetical protein
MQKPVKLHTLDEVVTGVSGKGCQLSDVEAFGRALPMSGKYRTPQPNDVIKPNVMPTDRHVVPACLDHRFYRGTRRVRASEARGEQPADMRWVTCV